MHDPCRVGRAERSPNLFQDSRHSVEGKWSIDAQRVFGGACLEQAEHEIGAAGLPPKVVQRHDMRVLQAGDHVSFGFKAMDERAIVREFRVDDFHRNISPNLRLGCPIDRAE